jgi:hypothetical protein
VPPPTAPPARPQSLSYGALDLYERCGYRFLAERVLGLVRDDVRESAAAARGTALHLVLELVPDGAPDAVAGVLRERLPGVEPEVAAAVSALAARWAAGPVAQRVAASAEVRRELPFVLAVGGSFVRGRIDLLARDGGTALVVDYKTGAHPDEDAGAVRDRLYGVQEAVYALAALDGGASSVEVVFAFLDDDAVAERRFTAEDRSALTARLEAAVRGALEGPYPARPEPFLCSDCPALGALCAGPALLEEPPWPD